MKFHDIKKDRKEKDELSGKIKRMEAANLGVEFIRYDWGTY